MKFVSIVAGKFPFVKALQDADGDFQGLCGTFQGETGLALFRQPGDVDEATAHRCARVMVQQGIQHIVADECAGSVGNGSGKPCFADCFNHGLYRQRAEKSVGAAGDNCFVLGRDAGIVGDPGIPDVDADPFRSDSRTGARLSHGDDHVRLNLGGFFQDGLGCEAENGWDLELMQLKVADLFRQQLHGFLGRVDGCTVEGIESGDQ